MTGNMRERMGSLRGKKGRKHEGKRMGNERKKVQNMRGKMVGNMRAKYCSKHEGTKGQKA